MKAWVHELMHKEALDAVTTKGGPVRRGTGRLLARQTVQHALNLVRSCLRDAVEEGVLRENPATEIRVPKRNEPPRETWRFLTLDEIEALRTCARIPLRYRLFYQVAIYTGLRKGELLGLRWEDVHLSGDRPRLVVHRSYDGPTKSGKTREVPLLPPARDALQAVRRDLGAVPMPSNIVWPAADGGCHHASYTGQWARYASRALKRHVRFHDLRHACASHLVMGSWGRVWLLHEVRDVLGHSSISVTERYAALSPDSIHGKAREMEAHFGSERDVTQ